MLNNLLFAWTSWIVRHAGVVVVVMGALTIAAGYHAITAFSLDSDTGKLIRQDTEWKRIHDEFIDTFPQYWQNSFVVVSGKKPDTVARVTKSLARDIKNNSYVFKTVFTPLSSDFTDRNLLLYLDLADLNDTVSKLADAQPLLSAIAKDSTLRGILQLLIDAFSGEEDLPTGLEHIAETLTIAADQAVSGTTTPISWRDQLFQVEDDRTFYQVIFIQGKQEFGKDLPNGLIMSNLRTAIDDFEHPYKSDVEIRISGQVPLEHGEIVSALDSAQLAGSLALLMLVVVLSLGVRSMRIIAATYITMIVGLIWTAALAMITVGQYNTISIIFLVMFIGLGVDFAVHLCLKYQESRTRHDKHTALIETGTDLGPAIMLCGITSALGFISFVPTEYIGIGQMGIISGGGMIIAVIVSLTLIPAFFALVEDPMPATSVPFATPLAEAMDKHAKPIAYGTLALALVLVLVGSRASFDYSTLSLKDPDSEAMTTLKELHDEDIVTDYALTYVAENLDDALAAKERLLDLAVVSEVRTPLDYLPSDQEEKLFILQDATFMLDSVLYPDVEDFTFTDAELKTAISELQLLITDYVSSPSSNPDLRPSLSTLALSLRRLAEAGEEERALFTRLIVPPLKTEIEWLKTALTPEQVGLDDLPPDLAERLLSREGAAVVSITPEEDVHPVEVMRRFTEEVTRVVPNATGRPVLDLGIGEIVLTAFATAIGIAVSTIFVILLLTLRSVVDALLVFIPLFMTAMATLSVSVLIDLPLNMANVVVIPLIFGLGVDNGIHIVKRFRQSLDVHSLVTSSTPKAVFLSNLTSFCTFCALSVSSHHGIYSIGVLLSFGLACLMLLTLVSLPALLATFSKPHIEPVYST